MDVPDAAGAIREMGRVVRRAGRCLMLFSHPCFDIPHASSWVSERRFGGEPELSLRLTRYREVFSEWLAWSSHDDFEFRAYHRPLSWYFDAIRAAGMAVTRFDEPEPSAEFMAKSNDAAGVVKFPLHCVIEARHHAPPR